MMSVEEDRRPWAGDPPQTEAARQRLVAAAAACIARDGLAATTVASVASEAGVSRPTVYRYFDDRDDLVRAALREAALELRSAVLERQAEARGPGEMIVQALLLALQEIPGHPVLGAMWSAAAIDGTVIATSTGRAGVLFARSCLEPAVAAAGWDDDEADEAAEVVLRLLLSLLVSPVPARSPDELRAFLHRRLLPGLALAPTAAGRPVPPTGGSR